MADQYQLTVSGNNFLFSKHISYDQLRRITGFLLAEGEALTDSATSSYPSVRREKVVTQQPETVPDLGMFINKVQAKRTPEKITTLAYLLWSERDIGEFTKVEIQKTFQEAMEPLPKNLSRDMRWTERIGWIEEKPDSPGVFYLTQSGKAAVEQKFPPSIRKKTVIARTRTKTKSDEL